MKRNEVPWSYGKLNKKPFTNALSAYRKGLISTLNQRPGEKYPVGISWPHLPLQSKAKVNAQAFDPNFGLTA